MEIAGTPGVTRHHISVTAVGGDGKTSLMIHYPLARGGRAIYFAIDPTSEAMESIPAKLRCENGGPLIPVFFRGRTASQKSDNNREYWYEEAIEAALYPWLEKFPDATTIIVDTMTSWSVHWLWQSAIKQQFVGIDPDTKQKKSAPSIGAVMTGTELVQPGMGDFGMSQSTVIRVLEFLRKQPLDLIVGFQPSVDKGTKLLGPGTVGSSQVLDLPYWFGTNLFLERVVSGKETKVKIHTQPDGIHMASVKTTLPFAHDPLIGNTEAEQVAFWKALLAAKESPAMAAVPA